MNKKTWKTKNAQFLYDQYTPEKEEKKKKVSNSILFSHNWRRDNSFMI